MALSEDRSSTPTSFQARAAIVNRTHRVIRERAAAMQARKRTSRDLIVPFAICSAVLVLMAGAVWSLVDEDALTGWDNLWKHVMNFGSDAGNTMSLLLVWFLPLTVITAAIVLLRRNRSNSHRDDEVGR